MIIITIGGMLLMMIIVYAVYEGFGLIADRVKEAVGLFDE
jgi:hypothetical protein